MKWDMCSKNKNLSKMSKPIKNKVSKGFSRNKMTVSEFFKKWTNQMKLNRKIKNKLKKKLAK